IAKLLVHLLQYRMKHAARRALKVTKLFQVDRRGRWSNRVGRLRSGNASVSDRLLTRRCLRTRRRRRLSGRWTRRYRSRQVPRATQGRTKNDENDDERKYSFHISTRRVKSNRGRQSRYKRTKNIAAITRAEQVFTRAL